MQSQKITLSSELIIGFSGKIIDKFFEFKTTFKKLEEKFVI